MHPSPVLASQNRGMLNLTVLPNGGATLRRENMAGAETNLALDPIMAQPSCASKPRSSKSEPRDAKSNCTPQWRGHSKKRKYGRSRDKSCSRSHNGSRLSQGQVYQSKFSHINLDAQIRLQDLESRVEKVKQTEPPLLESDAFAVRVTAIVVAPKASGLTKCKESIRRRCPRDPTLFHVKGQS